MRATVMYGAGDVRIENVPDARLLEPTDALVAVSRACICGSDLWPYKTMEPTARPAAAWATRRSASSRTSAPTSARIKAGDVVVMPFAYSDGTCVFCHEGLHTSCVHGGFFGYGGGRRSPGRSAARPAGGRHALRRSRSAKTTR